MKDQDTRILQSSKAKKQQHQEQIESLASLSTPVKNQPNPKEAMKKLLPVCKNKSSKKQALLTQLLEESPEREQENIVTATKQSKASSEEEDSTGSDMSEIQAKTLFPTPKKSSTSSTSIPSSMSVIDAKLEHLLNNCYPGLTSRILIHD